MIYAWIGRATVRLWLAFLRRRFGFATRLAPGVGVLAVAVVGYLLSRHVREG